MKVAESPEFLESVANHPRVLPYVTVKGVDRISFAPIWVDCIGLEFDTGGWVFHRQEPGVYEVHTLFLPKSVNVQEKAREALRYMFNLDATSILTQVATDLPHVRRLALRNGFKLFDSRRNAWERESGPVDVDYYELTQEAFATLESRECQ